MNNLIRMSKEQWERIGKACGWIKPAQLLYNFSTLELGPTPSGEPCAQIGRDDATELNLMEVAAFRDQCMRAFPNIPDDARYIKVRGSHDFGTYYELGIKYNEDDEAAVNYAFEVEANVPEYWDDIAKQELQQKGYFARLEQNVK